MSATTLQMALTQPIQFGRNTAEPNSLIRCVLIEDGKKTMLKPMSDADLAGLAAYFSSLK